MSNLKQVGSERVKTGGPLFSNIKIQALYNLLGIKKIKRKKKPKTKQ